MSTEKTLPEEYVGLSNICSDLEAEADRLQHEGAEAGRTRELGKRLREWLDGHSTYERFDRA